jgi:hypothetical protein
MLSVLLRTVWERYWAGPLSSTGLTETAERGCSSPETELLTTLASIFRRQFYKQPNSPGSAIPARASRQQREGGSRAASRVMH